MAIFEVESWLVVEGKEKEHQEAMRQWLSWVRDHRELFQQWKSVRYFHKYVAGERSGARRVSNYEPYGVRGLQEEAGQLRCLRELQSEQSLL
jgi:hypothetical protein